MHEELLTYCHHFDISLAVISSPMPKVKLYENLIEIINSSAKFEAAVKQCLTAAEFARAARLTAMARETWPQKVTQLCTCLGDSDGLSIGALPVGAKGVFA